MAARPRLRKRAHWPPHLHEPRPGYFVWLDPRDSKTHILGRIPVAQAIHEAHEANLVVENSKRTRSLADRLEEPRETIADLIKRMPDGARKKSTLDSYKYRDRVIATELGAIACMDLTTKHIADMLEKIVDKGNSQWAIQIRSRLKMICRRGKSLGWMKENPVEDTERAHVKVQRRRMTLEDFNATFEKAPEIAPYLQNAMLLALVSAQDLSTIATWERSFQTDGYAVLTRGKTGAKVAIPLEIRLNAIGMSLADVIARCRSTGVVSKYLIHHVKHNNAVPKGAKVKARSISDKFRDARNLAGITDDEAPTFHELRSLSKRLYIEQGGVDTKALLGHKSDATAALYADSRGLEPVKVRINVA